jgi:prepilin-type processing-associated H-X9-DG protein
MADNCGTGNCSYVDSPCKEVIPPQAGSLGWIGFHAYWWWSDPTSNNPFGWAGVDLATGYRDRNSGCGMALVGPACNIRRLDTPAEDAIRVEGYAAFGGWPGWNGLTFSGFGGNRRHLGRDGVPEGGHCMFADGHARWSSYFGAAQNSGQIGIPWWYTTWIMPRVPPALESAALAGPLSW